MIRLANCEDENEKLYPNYFYCAGTVENVLLLNEPNCVLTLEHNTDEGRILKCLHMI